MQDAAYRAISLPDGRRLAYEEYGDPLGESVFYFHGSPGSRLEGHLAHEAAQRQRLRIIAPERPGYGHSTFQRGRKFSDWPADIAALADALGIDRFAIVGLSGGGPHVVACAAALPHRVTAAAIVSGAGPIDAYYARSKSRIGLAIRRAFMPVTRVFIKSGVRLLPWALRRKSAKDMNTFVDKKVLARLEERERFRADLLEALRPGSRGAVQEFDLHTRSWPFSLGDVSLRVHLWHGAADVLVPVDIGRYVAAHLPRCDARILEGEGHLLIIDHIVEVLAALAADIRSRAEPLAATVS
jgi:pimeloyl-ACP methyl ester carboxylesterase